ncbi:MAG: UDP-N-acetylmuramoyl-L-alanyl-D-glutamate--2,6-diaminopimelate ligase [Rubricella sp.]
MFGPEGLRPPIAGLTADSNAVEPGFLFAALPGSRVHGADFAARALERGARAILTDAEGFARIGGETLPADLTLVLSADPRRHFALAAARFYDLQPGTIVAVTGTNGKTSVATFLRQIWAAIGHRAVNFGTTGVEGAVTAGAVHTTPEPVALHRLLHDLSERGVTHAAMEASSHGLDQRRLDGVRLAAAGFTHLSRDHLDYHGTMEAYAEAKLGLFSRVLPEGAPAVVNLDDPVSTRAGVIAAERGCPVLSTGRAGAARLRLIETRFTDTGQTIRFAWDGAERTGELGLVGGFQAENVLMAAGLAIAAGEAPGRVFEVLPHLTGVRGRMERAAVRANGAAIYVDYSHTPDGLASALKALRPHVPGRIVVVFGAGGDRDPGKRPMMGEAAAAFADRCIVTDDNPRSEDPAMIRAAILAACPGATEIGDRAEAIRAGVDLLGPEDALLIAGKGHETGQTVGETVLPFDDADEARKAVAAIDGGEP